MKRRGQNTSSAVMAQRREPPDSLDFYPTHPWATRALCEVVLGPELLRGKSVAEPAAGRGDMVRPLREYFAQVYQSDVFDYGVGIEVFDFLSLGVTQLGRREAPWPRPDWIITNPPFNAAADFVEIALAEAKCGVAILVRTSFVEGKDRYKTLFAPHPPSIVAPFVERVPLLKGRLDPQGDTATCYAWIVWTQGRWPVTELRWIPPCRKRLIRPGDYRHEPVAENRGTLI